MANDEQLAVFLDGGVAVHRFPVINIAVFVGGLEIGIQGQQLRAVFDDVAAVLADVDHVQHQVGVHPKRLGDGVVLIRRYHQVLASYVAVDVGFVELGQMGREEGVAPVCLAVGVRHVLGVDATREVAFRRGNLHVWVVGILRFGDVDLHQGLVTHDGRNDEHREVGFTDSGMVHGLGCRNHKGFALRGGHGLGLETGNLYFDGYARLV